MGHSEIPAISVDGRFVAFRSSAPNLVPADTNAQTDIFVHDRQRGDTTRVSVSSSGTQANGFSIIYPGGISGDGRIVVFASDATNLVAGDTNKTTDAFIHDRRTGTTTRLSVATNGKQGNSDSGQAVVSADGRVVAFQSTASNLVRGDTMTCRTYSSTIRPRTRRLASVWPRTGNRAMAQAPPPRCPAMGGLWPSGPMPTISCRAIPMA
jgi:Tol biopolymer transport system component